MELFIMNKRLEKQITTLLCLFTIASSLICMEPESKNAIAIIEIIKNNSEPGIESYLKNLNAVARSFILFSDWNTKIQETLIPSFTKIQTLLPYVTSNDSSIFAGLNYNASKHATVSYSKDQDGSDHSFICKGSKLAKKTPSKPVPAQQGPALIYEANNISRVAIIEPESRAALFQYWHTFEKITQSTMETYYEETEKLQSYDNDELKAIGKSIQVMILNNTCKALLSDYLPSIKTNSFSQNFAATKSIPSAMSDSLGKLSPSYFFDLYGKLILTLFNASATNYKNVQIEEAMLFTTHDIQEIISLNNKLGLTELHNDNTTIKNAYTRIVATLKSEIKNKKKAQFYPYLKFCMSPKGDFVNFPTELCSLKSYLQEIKQQSIVKITSTTPNIQIKKEKKQNPTKPTHTSTTKKSTAKKKPSKKNNNQIVIEPLKDETDIKLDGNLIDESSVQLTPLTQNNTLPSPTVNKPATIYAQRVARWFDENINDQEVYNADAHSMLYHSFPLITDTYIFSLGIQTPWQNQTNPTQIDTNYSLGGEILYPDGNSKIVLFTCCKDVNNVCYHRGFALKKGNSLFNEYFQHSKWTIDFPPFDGGVCDEKPTQMHVPENNAFIIKDNDLCVRIADLKNNVTIILYKPYQG